jgi:hypothetical protein
MAVGMRRREEYRISGSEDRTLLQFHDLPLGLSRWGRKPQVEGRQPGAPLTAGRGGAPTCCAGQRVFLALISICS